MALLSFEEVSAILYRTSDIFIRLTPEQQSLLVQAIAIFNDSEQWSDYDVYGDDIDALVSASEYALQVEDDGGFMLNMDIFCCNGLVNAGTFTYTALSTQPFNFAMMTDLTANRYIVNQTFYFKAGVYAYTGWYAKHVNAGITDIVAVNASGDVDTIVSNVDQYANPSFTRHSAAGTLTIPTDGIYSILARNDGTKNAASGGYMVFWTSHHFRQTS